MASSDSQFIELEIARGRLQSIVDDAGATLVRTAYSHILRDAKDFLCAILNNEGRTAVQSVSIPVFLGTMTGTAKHLLERFPLDRWRPGDVVGTNDIWLGTGHLYDLTVLVPVFIDGSIVGFASVVAHLADVGGRILDSGATQCFEEGFRIPPMRIATASGIDPVLLELLKANVRLPDQVVGDIEAMLNASAVIGTNLAKLCTEIPVDRFFQVCRELEARTEEFMRGAIAGLPDGSYYAAVDSEGVRGIPFTVKVRIDIAGDEMLVDFEGSSPQVPAGINCCYSYTRGYVVYALKCLLAPSLPFNDGILRPIRVTAPEGTIVNSKFPAAGSARNMVGHFLPTLILDALAGPMAGRVIAEPAAPMPLVRFSGINHRSGSLFAAPISVPGGLGARAGKDGLSAVCFPTNTETVPLEMLEASCPLLFEEKVFITDTGGAGQFQGGLGQRLTFRSLTDGAQASVVVQRRHQRPQGVYGGKPSSTTRVLVNGAEVDPSVVIRLSKGDTLSVESSGGGGYGDPKLRDPARVADDVGNGYLSPEHAGDVYGRSGRETGG